MTSRFYPHPKAGFNRIIQYGAMGVVIIMLISAPLQILLTLLGAPGGAFVMSAILTILLAAPVLMVTAVAPAVTVSEEGLTLHPTIWKERLIAWEDITAVKVFPLLPSEDVEVNRRIMVGRLKYKPAAGIMLVIPSLPWQYRIAGFFAGERAAPVIALTNRAHSDYEELRQQVLELTNPELHDNDLLTM